MPKLSLRDLFFIVTLAAVLVAWWVHHRLVTKDKQTIARENAKLAAENKGLQSELISVAEKMESFRRRVESQSD